MNGLLTDEQNWHAVAPHSHITSCTGFKDSNFQNIIFVYCSLQAYQMERKAPHIKD